MHNSAFSIQKLSEKNISIISNQYHRKVKDIYIKKKNLSTFLKEKVRNALRNIFKILSFPFYFSFP